MTVPMQRILKNGWERVLDALYPRRCPLCDRILPQGTLYHEACEKTLLPVPRIRCRICGRPLDGEDSICTDCKEMPHTFAIESAPYLYEGTMREAVHAMKFRAQPEIADALGAMLYEKTKDRLKDWQVGAVVPVPSHPSRVRKRGYDATARIARVYARKAGIPCRENLVRRTKKTPALKNLTRRERKDSLSSAFERGRGALPKKDILIIDDIYTTGATAEAVAEALREAGFGGRIHFLPVCIGRGFMVQF